MSEDKPNKFTDYNFSNHTGDNYYTFNVLQYYTHLSDNKWNSLEMLNYDSHLFSKLSHTGKIEPIINNYTSSAYTENRERMVLTLLEVPLHLLPFEGKI